MIDIKSDVIKKYFYKDYVIAGMILISALLIVYFSVVFLGDTITSLQVPGVLGSGPYEYDGEFTHRGLIDPGGSVWSPMPQTILVNNQLTEWTIPLWNQYMGIGQPLAGNMDSNAFNPLRILLHLFPSPYAWDLFLLFRLFLAGFFAYLFMKEIDISHLSSIFSSILFMLSGYFVFSIDMHHLDVEIILPLLLFSYEKIIKNPYKTKWWALCLLAIIFIITGGQPQSAALIFVIGFLYFYTRVLLIDKKYNLKDAFKYTGIYVAIHLIGFALTAPLLLTFIEYHAISYNNHDPSSGRILGLSYDPYFSDIVSFIAPYFMGPVHLSWLDGFSWHILTRGYFGISASIFALSAILITINKRSSGNKIVYFFGIMLIMMIGKLYGFFWINWIGDLPIANMLNFGKYMGSLMAFSVAVLAGIGLEEIVKLDNRFDFLKKSALFLGFVLVSIFFYYLKFVLSDGIAGSALFQYKDLLTVSGIHVILLTVLFALFFILTVLFVSKRYTKRFQLFILVIAFIELYIYVPNPGLMKNRNDRGDIFKEAPYISFLKNNLNNYRVVGIDRALYPDFGSAFGINDIRVIDALMPKRYIEFLSKSFQLPNPPDRFTGDEGIDFKNINVKKAINLLGVKYIISHSNILEEGIIDKILEDGEIINRPDGGKVSHWINSSTVNINGINKKVLFSHAPAQVDYKILMPKQATLKFSIGIVPGAWEEGDGVLFDIIIKDNIKSEKIFSKHLNPKNREQDRKWFDYSLNLSSYADKEVIIEFITSPGINGKKDNGFDWSVWGGIELEHNKNTGMFLVYDKEAKIYENPDAFPRAYIVHDYEVIHEKDDVLSRLSDIDFLGINTVILEDEVPNNLADQIAISTHPIKSTAIINKYESQQVLIHADMESPGFLVLSDLYYPGWNVYVDGKKDKIYRSNYIMRSIFLDKGAHEVEFVYEPKSFNTGVWVFAIAIIFAIVMIVSIRMNIFRKLQ